MGKHLRFNFVIVFWSYPVSILPFLETFGVGHLGFRYDVEYEPLFLLDSTSYVFSNSSVFSYTYYYLLKNTDFSFLGSSNPNKEFYQGNSISFVLSEVGTQSFGKTGYYVLFSGLLNGVESRRILFILTNLA